MANQNLFASSRGAKLPAATARNDEGAPAYEREARSALAVYAATGCLNGTFYASGEEQLEYALKLCESVDSAFVAKAAIYARRHAHMKDMPALLLATLSMRDTALFERAFAAIVDNGRMLRNVVQILRSGRVGRKSLGSLPKRLVQRWLETASVEMILSAAIGKQPSLADVIRMVHPKPKDAARRALYAWVLEMPYAVDALPAQVQAYESYKLSGGALPDVPFAYLTAMKPDRSQWQAIACQVSWQTLRMNLNTFARHGVFEDAEVTATLAAKLRDAKQIARARVLPYQLLIAALASGERVPDEIKAALNDAMEIATRNVPALAGELYVAVDVSTSMNSAVTGNRHGSTAAVRCLHVAALIAVCLQRANPGTHVLPFNTEVVTVRGRAEATVIRQARKLAALGGGGTAISAPLKLINRKRAPVDLLVIVSDNQSWADTRSAGATETMREWAQIKSRCPAAKLVCIDLQPYVTSQTVESSDVLHVGGFSDAVFDALAAFASDDSAASRWVERIDAIAL